MPFMRSQSSSQSTDTSPASGARDSLTPESNRHRPARLRATLRVRLFCFVVLPMLGVLFAIGFSLLAHLEREGENKMQEEVELIARALQRPLADALEKEREGSMREALHSAFRIGRVYGAYLYDARGDILATAGEADIDRRLQTHIPRVVAVGQRFGEYSRMDGRPVYSYFAPLKNSENEILGLLQITRRQRDFTDYMSRLRLQAGLYLLLGTALLTGIVYFGYEKAFGRSLQSLRNSMHRVEAGEHEHRARIAGPSELAGVAHSLNAMLDSIETARRQIEVHRASEASLEQQLQHSEKLAVLGQVAAGVAHELGTPLSLIDGQAQRLLRRLPENAPGAPLTNQIREQVRRMDRLVRQLLEFGRPHGNNRKRIRADQLADRSLHTLDAMRAEQDVSVHLHGDRPGPNLFVDPFRFELALGNLLQNAFQATPGGHVELSWADTGAAIRLRVADDGPGIPTGLQSQIFDPFFTTRKSARRSGLGLSVVQQVAGEHKARVEVSSSRWGGACFDILIPRSSS